jgi:hypothetical protein
MKLIIVLIAILGLSLGNLCPNTKFYNVQKAKSLYTGKYEYFESFYDAGVYKLFENGHGKLLTLEIKSISEGNITFIENEVPITPKPYYDANLVCNHAIEEREKIIVIKKHCLLEYITIEDKALKIKQVKFTYELATFPSSGNQYQTLIGMTDLQISNQYQDGCEKVLQDNLKQDKACMVYDVAKKYQRFEVKGINFDTNKRSFSLNGDQVIKLQFESQLARLTKDDKILVEYTSGPCFLLLEKINEILLQPREIYSEGKDLSYFDLTVSKGDNRVLNDPTPIIGKLKFDSLLKIELNGKDQEYKSFSYKILDNSAPLYEGLNVYLIFQAKCDTFFAFRVKLYFKECLNNLKKQLYKYQSCSDKSKPWILRYYKEVDLQTGIGKDLQGGLYTLDFEDIYGNVEEYKEDKKLKRISIYGIKYETEEGEEWLYIKGEAQNIENNSNNNNIINKKYLIKTVVNEACHLIIPEIQRKGSFHSLSANRGKFWFYQKEIDNSPVIKSAGRIKIKDDFLLNGKSIKFAKYERDNDALLLYGTEDKQDKSMRLYFCCKECLDKLIIILSKGTFWKKEQVSATKIVETEKPSVGEPISVFSEQSIHTAHSLRGDRNPKNKSSQITNKNFNIKII